MEGIMALSIPIIALVGMAITFIYYRRYQHMERMNMIERGMNPADLPRDNFGDTEPTPKRKHDPDNTLRNACLAVGAGLGLIVSETSQLHSDAMRLACLLVGGGAGLLAAYFLTQKNKKID